MSASAVHPGQTGHSGVRQYVAQVRAALDDLTPDEVEELTGGLEADLMDALGPDADPTDPVDLVGLVGTVDPADVFGEPGAYAAELRSAAGLPPRTSTPVATGGSLRRVAVQGRARLERDLDRLSGLSWWPAVSGFVLSLRPVWWVLRGWVAYQLAEMVFTGAYSGVLPDHLGLLVILLIAVVGSVELGRRAAAGRLGRLRTAVLLGNVLAVLTLPFALDHASQLPFAVTQGYTEAVPPEDGLWHEGREVRNVLAYDAQGRPLQGVRLFDENGKPLDVGTSARQPIHVETKDGGVQEVTQLPAVDADGKVWWNVYPLRQQARPAPDYAEEEPFPITEPYRPPTPSVAVPPLVAGLPSPTAPPSASPSASPSVTPAPTAGVTPSPSPSPSGASSPSEEPSPTP